MKTLKANWLAFASLTTLLLVAPVGSAKDVPAGTYKLELSHASLVFRVDHLGFSNYTARFKRFDATLQFDPKKPDASTLEALVDVSSIETDFPYPQPDFNKDLQAEAWFDAARHPQMRFVSKRVVPTGKQSFRIDGELTLRGVTKPVSLTARYNGGYAGSPMEANARIGFSAAGKLRRSEFGMSAAIPPAGSTMGVGDEVSLQIEAEFTGPPLAKPAAPVAPNPAK